MIYLFNLDLFYILISYVQFDIYYLQLTTYRENRFENAFI